MQNSRKFPGNRTENAHDCRGNSISFTRGKRDFSFANPAGAVEQHLYRYVVVKCTYLSIK